MKRSIIFIAFALVASSAVADIEAEYIKKNASVGVVQVGKYASFSALSNVGQYACEIEATAKEPAIMIAPDRLAWTPSDKADTCAVVMSFSGDKMTMTTKGCEGYCGLGAQRSLDGIYRRKATR